MSGAARLLQEQKALLPKDGPVPNRRVLVVDDEPQIADGIRLILSPMARDSVIPIRSSRNLTTNVPQPTAEQEFDVVVVHTPEDALKAVAEAQQLNQPFAMGFFDVVLGASIDGIQLVQKIFGQDSHMLAVFVTAYQDRSVDSIGGLLGEENRERWDYINKPFTEGEILQKARNATSLWDLHRLKEWQESRLNEAHQQLLVFERQSAVAAVGRSVAHEFGNLLTHITGNAELALENGQEPAMKNALDLILKASDTAANILKRFRSLQGQGEGQSKPVMLDIWQPLNEALELMEFQFKKYKISVTKSGVSAALVQGQRHLLVQVFVNLFMNALYVLDKGGGRIEVTAEDDGNWVQVSVHDSGPGIPEDVLPRVTEALFTTKGAKGSGLGLAICKEIVALDHEGELIVRNHKQSGAEILVRIPALKPKGGP